MTDMVQVHQLGSHMENQKPDADDTVGDFQILLSLAEFRIVQVLDELCHADNEHQIYRDLLSPGKITVSRSRTAFRKGKVLRISPQHRQTANRVFRFL